MFTNSSAEPSEEYSFAQPEPRQSPFQIYLSPRILQLLKEESDITGQTQSQICIKAIVLYLTGDQSEVSLETFREYWLTKVQPVLDNLSNEEDT